MLENRLCVGVQFVNLLQAKAELRIIESILESD